MTFLCSSQTPFAAGSILGVQMYVTLKLYDSIIFFGTDDMIAEINFCNSHVQGQEASIIHGQK